MIPRCYLDFSLIQLLPWLVSWRPDSSIPPAAFVRPPRMRDGARHSPARRGCLALRVSAGFSKEQAKLAAERAHASLRAARLDDEASEPLCLAIRMDSVAHQESQVPSLAVCAEFLFPPIPPAIRARPASAPALFGSRGGRGGGPVHGGGPLVSLQDSRLPRVFNPVNHPFGVSEMPGNAYSQNFIGVASGLDQTTAYGVANQTCCFMDV
jgi:hypothetical protein